MGSIYEMMQAVRLRLGESRVNGPGEALLLQQVCSHTRTLLRAKQNVGNPWNFADTLVDVEQGEDTYLLNVPSFGTPLAVLTRDDANPQHVVRMIPFFSPQNLYYNYALPNNIGAYYVNYYDGSTHSALRCSFFWKANQPYIQFNPIPYAAAQYQIRFLTSANGVDDMALTQDPVQAEDCDLIEIRAAKSLLSNTEWMAPDSPDGRAYNADKRKELIVTLRDDEALAKEQFDAANFTVAGPRIHTRFDMTSV